MKKVLLLIFIIGISTSCKVTYKVNEHTIGNTKVRVISNEFELQQLLRNDFNFRWDFAQYAITQPITWHYSNRFSRLNRFSRSGFNRGFGFNNYTSYMNRDQMWMDWVWNYPFNNGIGWSYSWNNNRWSSNSWNRQYGWDNYYGWNTGVNNHTIYNRRYNNRNFNSRRNAIAHAAHIQAAKVNLIKNKTVNIKRNDKVNRLNTRETRNSESRSNGRRRSSRENIRIKPTTPFKPPTIQPRQIRRRSITPVLQQTRSSILPSNKRRSSSIKRKN